MIVLFFDLSGENMYGSPRETLEVYWSSLLLHTSVCWYSRVAWGTPIYSFIAYRYKSRCQVIFIHRIMDGCLNGHLRSNGSQHEPNKNPGPLHDHKSYSKGLHPQPKQTTKLPHWICLSCKNAWHLQTTFSQIQASGQIVFVMSKHCDTALAPYIYI